MARLSICIREVCSTYIEHIERVRPLSHAHFSNVFFFVAALVVSVIVERVGTGPILRLSRVPRRGNLPYMSNLLFDRVCDIPSVVCDRLPLLAPSD